MNLTDGFVLKCLFGSPVFLDDICAIFPATIKEITDVGYENFLMYLNLALIEKPADIENSELNEAISGLSNFQYLILMAGMDPETNSKIREAFHFFTHDTISFSLEPPQIIVGPASEEHILNEEKYQEFRQIIRKMYFMDTQPEIVEKESDNPLVARIKKQMKKNRERLSKAKKVQHEDNDSMAFSDLVASLAIAQCGLNIDNIKNITYYAFHDQLKRMGWRDKFNINNRAVLAGAKLKKSELQHWMRPIDSKDKK